MPEQHSRSLAEHYPMVLHEDDDLLVVDKPAGFNTHSPAPFAGEGVYEWLRHREPRWATLAIIHRLDKETSGLLLFGKTDRANKSLTNQFATRRVTKTYVLVTDRPVEKRHFTVRSVIGRVGDKYSSRPGARDAQDAETRFRLLETGGGLTTLEAIPTTGRSHQIRVHASESGFPILGDLLYGGRAAPRMHLHATELRLAHPATGKPLRFASPAAFDTHGVPALAHSTPHPQEALRAALLDPKKTNAFRVIHGAADGWPGWYVDRLGEYFLSQSAGQLSSAQVDFLRARAKADGIYHKLLTRDVRRADLDLGPIHLAGALAPAAFTILENGLIFELSLEEGYSCGLFLDQRDNRRRFLINHVAAGFPLFTKPSEAEVLNAFAYTCAFSVCAAKAGARTTSLDLSRKYLDWGRRNFRHNQIDLAGHDFIYGDVFEWFRRLAKKGRTFGAVILDPPTSSHSERGFFTAEKHYGKLVTAALPLVQAGGVLLASTNAARLEPGKFLSMVRSAIASGRRRIDQEHYAPQPPDFPISREEPGYLKTLWLRLG